MKKFKEILNRSGAGFAVVFNFFKKGFPSGHCNSKINLTA